MCTAGAKEEKALRAALSLTRRTNRAKAKRYARSIQNLQNSSPTQAHKILLKFNPTNPKARARMK